MYFLIFIFSGDTEIMKVIVPLCWHTLKTLLEIESFV